MTSTLQAETKEILERLRQVARRHSRNGPPEGDAFLEDEAADLIERQAKRIEELELDIDHLKVQGDAIRAATIEECAKVAETYAVQFTDEPSPAVEAAKDIAEFIRALLTKGEAG